MKPPIIGPSSGPVKAAFAKIGKAKTRSSGDHKSEIDPPAQVRAAQVSAHNRLLSEIEVTCA